MNPIHAAALEIQDFARARAWRFCIIGALAVERWGEPPETADRLRPILRKMRR